MWWCACNKQAGHFFFKSRWCCLIWKADSGTFYPTTLPGHYILSNAVNLGFPNTSRILVAKVCFIYPCFFRHIQIYWLRVLPEKTAKTRYLKFLYCIALSCLDCKLSRHSSQKKQSLKTNERHCLRSLFMCALGSFEKRSESSLTSSQYRLSMRYLQV